MNALFLNCHPMDLPFLNQVVGNGDLRFIKLNTRRYLIRKFSRFSFVHSDRRSVLDAAAIQALAGESVLEKERQLSEMILQLQMVREQLLAQQEHAKVRCNVPIKKSNMWMKRNCRICCKRRIGAKTNFNTIKACLSSYA